MSPILPSWATRNRQSQHFRNRLPLAICFWLSLAGAGFAGAPADYPGHGPHSRHEIVEEGFTARATMASERGDLVSFSFQAKPARFVRLAIRRSHAGAACLDELEIYGPGSETNLALASRGAMSSASSVISGYPIHTVAHLNDGQYGNDHSWIPAREGNEWAQIELPIQSEIARVVISRDRTGKFLDRQLLEADVTLSLDGRNWWKAAGLTRTAPNLRGNASLSFPAHELSERTWKGAVTYAFLRERDTWNRIQPDDYLSPLINDHAAYPGGPPYWGRLVRMPPLERTLVQFEQMITRLAEQGLNTTRERAEWAALRQKSQDPASSKSDALYLAARLAKRRLFFRDQRLAPLERVLFVKRHPLKPSHNYSEHFDALFVPGGGVFVLHVPRDGEGRLEPARAEVEMLFDSSAGIVRNPAADFDATTIYFAYRPEKPAVAGWQSYWRLMAVRWDGTGLRSLTPEVPFHDFDPVPLPDGGLGFMSTRCKLRFLCWRPQAYVLHRMEPDGSGIRRLSHANISEWDPSVMRDGRILWTRSEYLDKGADFGHTLWAIRPDGGNPELVYGNDTPYSYGHAREVPGSRELVCTVISHGDHQGPTVLIDPAKGLHNTAAITSITPDTRPQYQMDRSYVETFRDPEPVSKDHFLVSHNPGRSDHWSLYVIDRFGNRELLYADPSISSKRPSPLGPRPRPPVLAGPRDARLAEQGLGQLIVHNIYEGLGTNIARGRPKYLQVSQEVPSPLEQLACGEYRSDHPPFEDYYAAPIHLVKGPPRSYTTRSGNALQRHAFRQGNAASSEAGLVTITEREGWPSYVAKAVLGTVAIDDDGSANFAVPAGKVLYFHLLDENFNELQRMRSVVQLQPGEQRSCIGCHEERASAPPRHPQHALSRAVQALDPPPWGAVPFDYERIVQPVLDLACVQCHNGAGGAKPDLRGIRDAGRVPASYRALISGGWVHYFDWHYGARHFKAEPLSFGTLQSRLFDVLRDENHKTVSLENEQHRALKAWIDLNCPLWPDYTYRLDRSE